VSIPSRADLELAAMLLANTAQQGGSIGMGSETRAALARVAAYLNSSASGTPRSNPSAS
jgi:hypothetical protein